MNNVNLALTVLSVLLSFSLSAQQPPTARSCSQANSLLTGTEPIIAFGNNIGPDNSDPNAVDCPFTNLTIDLRNRTLDLGNNVVLFPGSTLVNTNTVIITTGNSTEFCVEVNDDIFCFNQTGNQGNFDIDPLRNAITSGAFTTLGAAVMSVVTAAPVELTSFSAVAMAKRVEVSWTVAREEQNELFRLEHSTDGQHFDFLQEVSGRGNSNDAFTYSVSTIPNAAGDHYYRLTQRDLDGTETVLGIRSVNWKQGVTTSAAPFPNPVAAGRELNIYTDGPALVELVSINGSLIAKQAVVAGRSPFLVPSDVRNGLYLVRVVSADGNSVVHRVRVGQ